MEFITIESIIYGYIFINNLVIQPKEEKVINTADLVKRDYIQLLGLINRKQVKVDKDTLEFITNQLDTNSNNDKNIISVNGKTGEVVLTNTDVGSPSIGQFNTLNSKVTNLKVTDIGGVSLEEFKALEDKVANLFPVEGA